jgi:hypothetical protein
MTLNIKTKLLADPIKERAHFGILLIRGIGIIVVIADINALPLWGVDFGNAYREAKTKVYINGGPEFG